MTTALPVETTSARYNVLIGHGLLESTAKLLREQGLQLQQIAIITDENVQRFGHAQVVATALSSAGCQVFTHVIAPGDASKTLQTAEHLYHELLRDGLRRSDLIVALGGGVVGDVAGFVAATYQRGIRFVQIPTTLLAHDSSIGGKVGVNLLEAKNLVGAFHQPSAIVYDVEVLATLPGREWKAGMAEVIKHGIIGDAALFASLHEHPIPAYPGVQVAESIITQAAAVKVRIVGEDERDAQQRMKLNVGHTMGHAVEKVSNYRLNHGEAVSIGLRLESEMAVQKGMLPRQISDQITATLCKHGLPVDPPDLNLEDIMVALRLDKKHEPQRMTFAVPFAIGDVRIVQDFVEDDVRLAWNYCQKERSI
jgi:3-dehydroquinate synthase